MKYTENALNVMAVLRLRGIGRSWVAEKLSGTKGVHPILSVAAGKFSEDDLALARADVASILEGSSVADGVVALGDEDFPLPRGDVRGAERPAFLVYKGDISLLGHHNKSVAAVGLLDPDDSTVAAERQVVKALVALGITVVSGLAQGCDSVAHRQALDSGGKTIAILPGTIDRILPRSNAPLAEEIVENGGLLITEYYEEATSRNEQSSRYVERDRLQALYSDAVILAASYAKNDLGLDSGSRHAMAAARKYSIPRAVIYDEDADLHNPKYDLARQLIAEQANIGIIKPHRLQETLVSAIERDTRAVLPQASLFG
ncbi:MAG: DNA-processing protein DprA [Armatimonadetes bacterium]|nr:DNA-processing protein DprA [Armatimonadota bacterium]